MTATGSPAGASMFYDLHVNGRIARSVDYDERIHTAATEGRFWDRSPFGTGQILEWQDGAHLRPTVATGAAEKSSPTSVEKSAAVTEAAPVAPPLKVQRAPKGRPSKFQYLEALRDARDLTHAEFHLLVNLLTYADADLSNARPGHARLAAHMGYGSGDPRQVRKLLDSLERKGYVEVQEPGTNTGSRRATTHRLVLPIRQE